MAAVLERFHSFLWVSQIFSALIQELFMTVCWRSESKDDLYFVLNMERQYRKRHGRETLFGFDTTRCLGQSYIYDPMRY